MAGWIVACVAGIAAAAEDPVDDVRASMAMHLGRMAVDGGGFDPQPVIDSGIDGMRAMLDHVFPETAKHPRDRRAEIQRLIEQLGDDSFVRREQAAAELRGIGWLHVELLSKATEHEDAEIRFRVREILEAVKRGTAVQQDKTQKIGDALAKYLNAVDDLASQQELANRVAKSLTARLDQTAKARMLNICLNAMANWQVDLVHEELLTLLEHEDPAVAIFAMQGIGGRTGNGYIAPIHMGAIASGRRELVKCGFRSMPCPIWDRKNKPIVHEAYLKVFAGNDPAWDFSDDDPFMQTSAFVAARDFHIAKARDWLLQRMGSDDESKALRAIQSLGDTYYMRRPIYPELLAALKQHLAAGDARFRAAAVNTVGVYQGEEVLSLLLKAFADTDKNVWQTAGRRLADQHGYHRKGQSPIPKLIAEAIERSDDDAFDARATFLLQHVQKERPGYLQWPQ